MERVSSCQPGGHLVCSLLLFWLIFRESPPQNCPEPFPGSLLFFRVPPYTGHLI